MAKQYLLLSLIVLSAINSFVIPEQRRLMSRNILQINSESCERKTVVIGSSPNLDIDGTTRIRDTISFAAQPGFEVEDVILFMNITHAKPTDLNITLAQAGISQSVFFGKCQTKNKIVGSFADHFTKHSCDDITSGQNISNAFGEDPFCIHSGTDMGSAQTQWTLIIDDKISNIANGKWHDWGLTLNLIESQCTTPAPTYSGCVEELEFVYSSPNLQVGELEKTDVITVGALEGYVIDVVLFMNIDMQNPQYLDVYLEQNGISQSVWNKPCGAFAFVENINASFSDSFVDNVCNGCPTDGEMRKLSSEFGADPYSVHVGSDISMDTMWTLRLITTDSEEIATLKRWGIQLILKCNTTAPTSYPTTAPTMEPECSCLNEIEELKEQLTHITMLLNKIISESKDDDSDDSDDSDDQYNALTNGNNHLEDDMNLRENKNGLRNDCTFKSWIDVNSLMVLFCFVVVNIMAWLCYVISKRRK